MDRSSGILLPVSALPGPCGIGDLGKDARDFIDFLAAAGQRYWQILPLNPPDGAYSPYLSASTFAGSTDLLSPEPFVARGALTLDEVRAIDWGGDPMRVDYARVHAGRTALWDTAFARERDAVVPALRAALAAEPWLRDYCLYMALKEEQGGAPWYAWPQPLRDRDAAARAAAAERLDDRVLLHAYLQTEFTRQWDAVRAYAHAHGVRIIGDLPMYVAPDSADVWAQSAQFCLDPDGQPSAAAGVPPDYFSADGQLWGNPLYDWDAMRADGFRWWKDRIRGAAKRYDVVRIDHFRAISSYWVVPRGELTARGGHWAPAPARRCCRRCTRQRPSWNSSPRTSARSTTMCAASSRAPAARVCACCSSASTPAARPSTGQTACARTASAMSARTTTRPPPRGRRSAARTPTMPCAASVCTMSRACRRRCCAPAWVRAQSCLSRRCRTCSASTPRAA